jgi:hypothetical protein
MMTRQKLDKVEFDAWSGRRPRFRVVEWRVAFETSPWQHVLCFGFDGRSWIVVDPQWGGAEVFTIEPGKAFDAWVLELASRAEIFALPAQDGCGWRGLFCVGVVKRMIGLRSGALSPRALRRDLLRAGARQVYVREGQDPKGRPARQGAA